MCAAPEIPWQCYERIGPVSCSVGTRTFSYLCRRSPYGCSAFDAELCTWSGYTDASCQNFQSWFCG